MEKTLTALREQLGRNPENAELWLELGLELAESGQRYEAVEAFSMGLSHAPMSHALLLARGRRHISLRRYAEALADTAAAAALEPNSFDNWYYQGVACCLLEDYARAAEAMGRCLPIAEESEPEMLWPITAWLWLINMRAGRKDEAAAVLGKVDENAPAPAMAPSYKKIVLLYKGLATPEGFIDEGMLSGGDERAPLYYITETYCLSNYLYLNGDVGAANDLLLRLKEVTGGRHAFAYLLAEQDMRRRGLG
ncbi:MAG: hypothetical protein LBG71_00440 [Clostridiales Family XIII bacterium]|jgi:tetratricopeptide (TPR) repeat protein|nr:hypothetical protein [Clostridiales Family XIII bacterium]